MIPTIDKIQIETVQGCTRKCWHCPNKYIESTADLMDMQLFRKIISDLKSISFTGIVFPYLMNEPFKDYRMFDMIDHIRKELPRCKIEIDSNGDVIDPDRAEYLREVKQVDLAISCYTTDTFEKFVHTALPLEKHFIKGSHDYLYYNRGGNLDIGDTNYTGACERPFNQMYIRYNGKAVLCCSDYKFDAVMGDVNSESLLEIWKNDRYALYRADLVKGERSLPLCNKCNYKSGAII